jgi:hypothetical protein
MMDLERDGSPDAWPFAASAFDAVIVCNYLWRPTFERMLATIKPKGVLLYETFMVGNERYGKPSRPEFLLAAGELQARTAHAFETLDAYEGAIMGSNDEIIAMKAMIAARKR